MNSLITRREAEAGALPSYFMAVPCARGHVAPRRTRDGYCRACQRATPSQQRRRSRRGLDLPEEFHATKLKKLENEND